MRLAWLLAVAVLASGSRAVDLDVEGVSLAGNFRAQFRNGVAKEGFEGLLDRLRSKVATPVS